MRPHVHALYAFMRYADEIVDNPGETSLEEQLAALEAFEQETMAAVAGEAVPNPCCAPTPTPYACAASRRRI